MAGVMDSRIEAARSLLEAAQEEYQRARQEPMVKGIITFKNACGKAWLAVLEATSAFFLKQGVREEELPQNDRGRSYFVRRYMDRDLMGVYVSLRETFHIEGYYGGLLDFEDMPEYFEELREFIETIRAL